MGARGPLPKEKINAPAVGGEVPPPPAWLGKIARAEYLRVIAEQPTLRAADAGLLASYAAAFAEVAEHTKQLPKEGYTSQGDRGAVLNPRVRALDRARAALLSTAIALGLTPASRARIPATDTPASNQSTDTSTPNGFSAAWGADAA
jgi:P27 family predicted phage terminase small subunit